MKTSRSLNVLVVILFILFGVVYVQFIKGMKTTVKTVQNFNQRIKGLEETQEIMNAKMDILFKETQSFKKSLSSGGGPKEPAVQQKSTPPRTVL
jgi:predicted PurR-regulated permease PerM